MRKLRNKQGGFIVSMELIFIATILVIGLITGWSAVRTAVVTELADVGQAVAVSVQSYEFSGATGHHARTSGSQYVDFVDSCDVEGRCIQLCEGFNRTPGGPER